MIRKRWRKDKEREKGGGSMLKRERKEKFKNKQCSRRNQREMNIC
jgi:hypothetical protein